MLFGGFTPTISAPTAFRQMPLSPTQCPQHFQTDVSASLG